MDNTYILNNLYKSKEDFDYTSSVIPQWLFAIVIIVGIITILAIIKSNCKEFKELFDFWNIRRKDKDHAGNLIAAYSYNQTKVKGMYNTLFALNILNTEDNYNKLMAIFFCDLVLDGKISLNGDSVSFKLRGMNKYQRTIIDELFGTKNMNGLIFGSKDIILRYKSINDDSKIKIRKTLNDALRDSGYAVKEEDAWYLSRWFNKKWKEKPMKPEEILMKYIYGDMCNLRYIYSIIFYNKKTAK